MRTVVTGGSGFIGSFIVEQLAAEGHDVVIFDIARPTFPLGPRVKYFEGSTVYTDLLMGAIEEGTDEVYDLAGVLGTSELMAANARAVDYNIHGAVNVLEVCRRRRVPRIFHPTKPNDWLNTYSITKYAAERFALMYAQQFGMSVAVTKWFNAYGPRQHLYPVRKALPLFIVQALRDLPLEIYGDGEQTVDMIYVSDIARIAIAATRECGCVGKVLEVGSGVPVTVNELARRIVDAVGSSSPIVHLPMRPGEPLRSDIRADVVELRRHIDYGETIGLEEGLRASIEYYASLPQEEVDRALEYFGAKVAA